MYLSQLFESTNQQIIAIFGGRFQPVTRNHFNVYRYLAKEFGSNNVFIATSNKTEAPKSPFSFNEKKALLEFIGIPGDHIVETKSPYAPKEITQHYNPETTVLIFAVGQKDMEEDPRFSFAPKKDGSPSYFQPYKKGAKLESFGKHAYITAIPNFKFDINGQSVMGATQIRAMFANADEKEQKQLFTELYGKFNPKLFSLVSSKLSGSKDVEEGIISPNVKSALKRAGAGAAMTVALAGGMHHTNSEDPFHDMYKYITMQHRKGNDERRRLSTIRKSNDNVHGTK